MNIPFFRFTIFLLLLFILPHDQLAQSASFRKLTVEDGLSNNFVRSIHKDHWGYIWFGTLEGLDRFDGVELRSFTDRFPVSKPGVNCMVNDPKNGLWIGTQAGLYYWDYLAEKFQPVEIGLGGPEINSLYAIEKDSILYVGSSVGIFSVNCQTKSVEELVGGITALDVLYYEPSNVLYFASEEGLVELQMDSKAVKVFRQDINPQSPLNRFSTVVQANKRLIVGTETKGLFLFDPDSKQFNSFVSVGSNYILTTVYNEAENSLLIGTDGGGLAKINMESLEVELYTHVQSNPSSLSSNSIYSLLMDEMGRCWIGTYSAGINYSKGLQGDFQVADYEGGVFFGQKSVRSLFFEDDGYRFIGTREGFYVFNQPTQEFKFFRNEDNEALRSNIILSFFPLNLNEILVGTYGGGISLYNKREGTLEIFLHEEDLLFGAVYGFQKDDAGNLWILSLNGLYKYNLTSGAIENFNENNSAISNNLLYSVYLDQQNRLWLGSMSGVEVFEIESGIPRKIVTVADLPTFKTVYFYEDSTGHIWMATEQGGLFRVNAQLDEIGRYTDVDGLPNNSISAITEYPVGVFWISTLKGLCRYDRNLNRFQYFSMSDGLPGLVFNPGAVVNNSPDGGDIWLGNENGLVHFHPDSIRSRGFNPVVQITDFYIEGKGIVPGQESVIGKPIEELSEIRLTGNQNSFGFRFVSLNYFSSSDNPYVYRMLGHVDDWVAAESPNRVAFQNMKPGKYVFEVCLSKGGNQPDLETKRSLVVIVAPLFYQRPFILISVALVLMAGLLLLFLLIRNLKRKMLEGQKQKKEREMRERYEFSRLTSEQSKQVLEKVSVFIQESRSYLNADLKINDVAKSMDCSPHDISQAINQNLNKSFNDFINGYRVEAVKSMMADREFAKYTLMALAEKCGFNSKTSFYRIFKKETGQTPAEFLRGLE